MKTRLITAAIMIAIVLPCLIIGNIPLMILIGAFGFIGNHELLECCGKEFTKVEKFLTYLLLLFLFGSFKVNNQFLLCYLVLSLFVFTIISFNKNIHVGEVAIYFMCYFLLTGFLYVGLMYRKEIKFLLYIILTICCTDAFALFGGVLFGKHKLCEHISPKKTIEGSVSGTIFGTLIGFIYYYFFITKELPIYSIILITLGLSIVGQIGDLFFSKVKRNTGIKDFGKLLPGHGGIMDRIDSLSFGFIYFYIITIIL